MITVLLQKILDLLEAHFPGVITLLSKLNLIEEDTEEMRANVDSMKTTLEDVDAQATAAAGSLNQINTTATSINGNVAVIKNNSEAIKNNVMSMSTNVGNISAYSEATANNTLDIDEKITSIASDTTQIRTNSNSIALNVGKIVEDMEYYFLNNFVTEDVNGIICNFNTDLDDYLQLCRVNIPADLSGFSGITLTKCGKNLFNLNNYLNLRTNYDYLESSYYCKAIKLKPNTTYTVSQNSGIADTAVILINKTTQVNSSGFFDLRKTNDVKTYTTDNTGNLYIGIISTGTDAQVNSRLSVCNLQIEESNVETTYEAYKDINYPVSFGSTITDGAEIDLLEGIAKINTSPVTYLSFQPIAIRTYKGVNNIYADVGETALTYRETLKHYLDKRS